MYMFFSGGSVVKNPPAVQNLGSIPGLGRSPGEGNGNPLTPMFLSGESHRQRCLTLHGVTKESDMTLQLNNNTHFLQILFLSGLSEDTGHGSLCRAVGPCLSILCVTVCICQPHTPAPSLPFPLPLATTVCSL